MRLNSEKIKSIQMSQKIDLWDELHSDVKKEVTAAIVELDNGKGFSNELVMKKYKKWLEKII